MDNRIDAIIKHQTPTRVRIKVAKKESNHLKLLETKDVLERVSGVNTVTINLYTHSILINHDRVLPEILSTFKSLNYSTRNKTRVKAREKLPQMRSHIKKKIHELDKNIIEFTDGELDLNFLCGVVLTGMGYYQTFRARHFLPPGENLFVSGIIHLLKEGALEDEI